MRLASLDLNLLVTLDALLRERNITRAGRRVGLSQPAMSAALARARDMFGDPLLVRQGRGYVLTPLAESVRVPLQEILVSIERTLERRATFDPRTAKREFRIAASDYVVIVLGQALTTRLAREAPLIRLRFQPLQEDAARLLSARRLDLTVHPIGALRGFESQPLFEERWTTVVWKGNRQVGKRLDKATFSRLPHVEYALGRREKSAAERTLDALGVEREVEVLTETFASIPFLVHGSRRIAVMHERLAQQLQSASHTRLLPLPYKIPNLVEAMSWHALDTTDPAHSWFRSIVSETADTL